MTITTKTTTVELKTLLLEWGTRIDACGANRGEVILALSLIVQAAVAQASEGDIMVEQVMRVTETVRGLLKELGADANQTLYLLTGLLAIMHHEVAPSDEPDQKEPVQ